MREEIVSRSVTICGGGGSAVSEKGNRMKNEDREESKTHPLIERLPPPDEDDVALDEVRV